MDFQMLAASMEVLYFQFYNDSTDKQEFTDEKSIIDSPLASPSNYAHNAMLATYSPQSTLQVPDSAIGTSISQSQSAAPKPIVSTRLSSAQSLREPSLPPVQSEIIEISS